jgi:hypothetical protein
MNSARTFAVVLALTAVLCAVATIGGGFKNFTHY